MEFTHFDKNGNAVMVDVTEKSDTVREALAAGMIQVSEKVYAAVKEGSVKKGDVLAVAATAGIMGAKKTAELIPMCHILPLTGCRVWFEMEPETCHVTSVLLSAGLLLRIAKDVCAMLQAFCFQLAYFFKGKA